jgi:hypothetical protein
MTSGPGPVNGAGCGLGTDRVSCRQTSAGDGHPRWRGWQGWGLLLVAWLGLGGGQAFADTEVRGVISQNAVWTLAGSPYRVMEHVTVAGGVRLTVEAGVEVRVGRFQALYVDGELRGVGQASAPVRFLGIEEHAGWWRGIQVRETGSLVLEHAVVAHGGYWDTVTLSKVGTGSMILRHTTVRDGSGDGLRLGPGASECVMQDNRF